MMKSKGVKKFSIKNSILQLSHQRMILMTTYSSQRKIHLYSMNNIGTKGMQRAFNGKLNAGEKTILEGH